jgi:hypothetical protein
LATGRLEGIVMFANYSNVTDVAGLLQMNNTVTDGAFAYIMIFCIWLVTFMALSAYRKDVAIIPASFVTFLVCAMMVLLGLLAVDILLIITVLLLLAYILFHLAG